MLYGIIPACTAGSPACLLPAPSAGPKRARVALVEEVRLWPSAYETLLSSVRKAAIAWTMLLKPCRASTYSGVDNRDGPNGIVPLVHHHVPNLLRLDREATVAEEQLSDVVGIDEGLLWIRPVDHFADADLGAAAGPPTTVHGVGCPENVSVGHLCFNSCFLGTNAFCCVRFFTVVTVWVVLHCYGRYPIVILTEKKNTTKFCYFPGPMVHAILF